MGRCVGESRLLPELMLQSESRVSGDKPSCDEVLKPLEFPSTADVKRRRRGTESLGASSSSHSFTDGLGGGGVGCECDSLAMVQSVSRIESRLGFSKLS